MAQAEIMRFLEKNRGQYFTSLQICNEVKISRTAIIRALTKMSDTGEVKTKPMHIKGYYYGVE